MFFAFPGGRVLTRRKKSNATQSGGIAFLEQATGIEPASPAWEAGVLPLDYACERIYYSGWE